jgi:hypothetical protein
VNNSLKRLLHFGLDGTLPRVPVFLLRGPTWPTGRAGTMLLAGEERWSRYLPGRFFAEPPQRERLGAYPVWALPRVLARHRAAADLTVARVDQMSARLFFDDSYLRVPEWVRLCVPVPADLKTLIRAHDSLREDVRVVRRNGLQPRITHDDAEFDAFYRNDYVPYARTRHGEDSFVFPQRFLRKQFRRGGLLWVEHEGRRLSGTVFPALLKQGAFIASYIFCFDYARQRGIATVDLRGCRPSLHDNLFRYKRKWSAVLRDKADNVYDWLVRWHTIEGVVTEFLTHTSLIFRDGDDLSAIHADPTQTRDALWTDGLREIYCAASNEG